MRAGCARAMAPTPLAPAIVTPLKGAQPWAVIVIALLVFALLLVVAMASYIAVLRRRRQALERLIESRTAELGLQQEEAERATWETRNLLHRVSHDIRSPLNNIFSAIDLIEVSPDANSTARWVAFARTAGSRLTVMLDDLIAHARSETGRERDLHRGPIAIEGVVRASVLAATTAFLEMDRQVEVHFEQSWPTVLADENALRQLLTNLVINAINHSQPGAILIRCRDGADPRATLIEVSDPGCALAQEQLRHLREPYRRGEGVGGVGLGLGLTVAQALSDRLGAELRLVAGARGTTASVELTARVSPVRRVLIADDDEVVLVQLAAGLHASGYQVQHAGNHSELLAAIAAGEPDLIVVDHFLGPHVGAEVLAGVPSRMGSPWSPRVIGISSDPERAIADGRYATVLGKPVDGPRLVQAIRRLDRQTHPEPWLDVDGLTSKRPG